MISNVSWATYSFVTAIATLLYYLYVGYRYYYHDLKRTFGQGGGTILTYGTAADAPSATGSTAHVSAKGTFEENSFNDFETVEELVDRVKALITESVEHKSPKDSFLSTLHHILKDYPSMQHSQFRPSVNEFIITESEAQGMPAITTEEVEQAWRA